MALFDNLVKDKLTLQKIIIFNLIFYGEEPNVGTVPTFEMHNIGTV